MSNPNDAQIKVMFVEDMIEIYRTGLKPTRDQVKLAKQLQIDLEAIKREFSFNQ
jgi:hypothetical protein